MNGFRGFPRHSIARASLALMAFYMAAVEAQDGSLDSTFGNGGVVEIQWPAGYAEAKAAGIDPQGRIIVGGSAIGPAGDPDFALFRLSSAGLPDASFASDGAGFRLVDFDLDGIGTHSDDLVNDLVLYPDGSFVALGEAHFGFAGVNSQFALARMDAGGVLDSTFAENGTAHFASGSFSNIDYGRLLRVDDQQRILAVGMFAEPSTDVPGALNWWLGLARLTPQGQFDSSFHGGGLYFAFFWTNPTIPPPRHSNFNLPAALALDDSKRILVGGYVENPIDPDAAVYRAAEDGGSDPIFGQYSNIQFGLNGGEASALLPTADGTFLVAGGYLTGENSYALFFSHRLSDGSSDPAFGDSGIISVATANAYPEPSLIAPTRDGGWLVAGRLNDNYGNGIGVVLARFTAQGQLEVNFGTGGLLAIDVSDGRHFAAGSAAMQSDGKVVVVGSLPNSIEDATPHFAVLRILADYDTLFVNGFETAL